MWRERVGHLWKANRTIQSRARGRAARSRRQNRFHKSSPIEKSHLAETLAQDKSLPSPEACPRRTGGVFSIRSRSEEHTSELQSLTNLVCRLLLEKKKTTTEM